MIEKLKKLVHESLIKLGIEKNIEIIIIEVPREKKNGDYSTNIALQLCKELKINPLDLAQKIIENIIDEEIDRIEVAKPGFINFFVKKTYLFNNLNKVLMEKADYGKNNIGNGTKVDIEFVSANPTGTLHVGHGRGAVYGSSLANILRFCGYDVTREYYINDGGNQIINLNRSIKIRYNNLCGKSDELDDACYHGKEIIEVAKNIYDEYGMDATDDIIFKYGMDYLLSEIRHDLNRFKVEFDVWTSEKKLYETGAVASTLKSLIDSGYTFEEDGAIWLKTSIYGDDKDRVLVKNDKTYTYLLPDIANHCNKYDRGYDKIIDVLGADHHGYINRLKASIKMMNYNPDKLSVKILQMVRLLKQGEEIKLSKRTGKTITLSELMDEVGVDAVRYFFANKSLDTQLDFDMDLATSKSNENPIYYIQYAHARISSILKEYKKDIEIIDNYDTIESEYAYNLLVKIYEFSGIVELAARKYAPHVITNYVYDLANTFHVFYNFEKVLTGDEKYTKERINLIKATSLVIENALNLISIEALETM